MKTEIGLGEVQGRNFIGHENLGHRERPVLKILSP